MRVRKLNRAMPAICRPRFLLTKSLLPVNAKVYEIQNAMHLESVKALRPGIPYMEVYELSARVMVEGMKTLGLMKGNAEDAVREGAHALFYPHGLGHMMGLDVHDMETWVKSG